MLIYRDVRNPRPTVHRIPAWLEGCRDLVRQHVDGHDWLWCGNPAIRPSVPANAWHRIPDEDFEVASVGPLDPMTLLRHRPELLVSDHVIPDGQGREWRGLIILDGDGHCRLTLGWGRREGEKTLSRVPEPWQVPLIAGALAARAEIEAGNLADVPVEAAMSWLLPALCEIYHLHPEVIIRERLVDDRLANGLLRLHAGYAPET